MNIDKRDVTAVYDVYHRRHYVNSVDLAKDRPILPLYNAKGERLRDKNDSGEVLARANLVGYEAEKLRAALVGLFEHCVMVHKHWGDSDNAKAADTAIATARAAIGVAQ